MGVRVAVSVGVNRVGSITGVGVASGVEITVGACVISGVDEFVSSGVKVGAIVGV